MASAQSDLDGPLVDCAAKGTKFDLDRIEKWMVVTTTGLSSP
jgi:hypothetical protein